MNRFDVLLLVPLVFLPACGKSNSNAGLPIEKKKSLPVNGSNIEGIYHAEFSAINPQAAGSLQGSATLLRRGDSFKAFVKLVDSTPRLWHPQNVYLGNRCPTEADDGNGDGYVDAPEGERAYGKILLPLDSNLRSQAAGQNVYPVADLTGSYFYERDAGFGELFADLRDLDPDETDDVVKLGAGQGLDFSGKVVVVHGVSSTETLPETVAGKNGQGPHRALPVACGVLKQVTKVPDDVRGQPGQVNGPRTETPRHPGTTTGSTGEPAPEPTPGSDGEPRDRSPEGDRGGDGEEEAWYGRVIDWWTDPWEREGRRQTRGRSWEWP
jgi:hypothetical protein